jgi:hypothetical protein
MSKKEASFHRYLQMPHKSSLSLPLTASHYNASKFRHLDFISHCVCLVRTLAPFTFPSLLSHSLLCPYFSFSPHCRVLVCCLLLLPALPGAMKFSWVRRRGDDGGVGRKLPTNSHFILVMASYRMFTALTACDTERERCGGFTTSVKLSREEFVKINHACGSRSDT